jgi:Uri superfamily endonuclease
MSNLVIPWTSRPQTLPPAPGAYALLIRLPRRCPLPPRFGAGAVLPAGRYLYLGAAKGGGGIRARCTRHMAAAKTLRWHVAWLTTQPGATVRAAPFPGGDECTLTARALAAGATVPVRGLGASDCPHCPAHLLRLPDGLDLRSMAAALGGGE